MEVKGGRGKGRKSGSRRNGSDERSRQEKWKLGEPVCDKTGVSPVSPYLTHHHTQQNRSKPVLIACNRCLNRLNSSFQTRICACHGEMWDIRVTVARRRRLPLDVKQDKTYDSAGGVSVLWIHARANMLDFATMESRDGRCPTRKPKAICIGSALD